MQKVSVIYKTLVCGGEVSLAAIDATALVNEAIRRHALTPVAAAALGRTLSATAYLCSWLKEGESSLSVTLNGGGAGGKIFAAGDGNLFLRGFVERPDVMLPPRADGKLDVGSFVGNRGTLTVIRDDGEGIPFVGTCELCSGEIAEDFSAYFLTSEQRPTALALGVGIGTDGFSTGAGGVFLQPLPGASEESIRFAEEEICRYSRLSSLIAQEGVESVLAAYPHGDVAARTVSFRCHCSRERAEGIVRSLGAEEAESILAEQGKISVYCHYCNTSYEFGEEQVRKLFAAEEGNGR